ncbi:cytochrome P450 [Pseudonocardia charpentierae]|uniref:Cytochrome P450 n=1 Tax=Pseudonocardia charpentierae TaxID=3075545 RepID=A0ABU2NJB0_9PSEU|nr:cytochrome P450 [Pseudonocardia sp. DSM 45834]MDT0353503.1 cytochrome P450 [Pseudonocardia sp. DSM 45834]
MNLDILRREDGGPRQVLRWGLHHGVARPAISRMIRQDDLGARITADPLVLDDPYPYYEQLRARGRLVRTALAPMTVDHALSAELLRNPHFGTTALSAELPRRIRIALRLAGRGAPGPGRPPSMLAVDPPDHTRYRKLVTRAFSAKVVAGLRTRVEQIAEDLLDDILVRSNRTGTSDLIADYAAVLPATVIVEMLGAPPEMQEQFLEWGAGGILSLDVPLSYRDFRRCERDLFALHRWMIGHFAHLRKNPGDNILSHLIAIHDEGQHLTEDELSSLAMLLLVAGFETTVNLIGSGAALLAHHRDQLDVVRSDPARWGNCVDEILRYESPVQRTARVVQKEVEFGGETLRPGEFVVSFLGGANRDPEVFTDPHTFDVTRPNANKHIAFSGGIHYCLGAGLAKMEGEIALRALFKRFPDLSLVGPPHRRPTAVLRGFSSVPARLTSGAARYV